MKTHYLPTFIKDIESLKSTSSYSAIKNLVFTDILAVQKKIPLIRSKLIENITN